MTDLSTLPTSKWSEEQIEAYCEESGRGAGSDKRN